MSISHFGSVSADEEWYGLLTWAIFSTRLTVGDHPHLEIVRTQYQWLMFNSRFAYGLKVNLLSCCVRPVHGLESEDEINMVERCQPRSCSYHLVTLSPVRLYSLSTITVVVNKVYFQRVLLYVFHLQSSCQSTDTHAHMQTDTHVEMQTQIQSNLSMTTTYTVLIGATKPVSSQTESVL